MNVLKTIWLQEKLHKEVKVWSEEKGTRQYYASIYALLDCRPVGAKVEHAKYLRAREIDRFALNALSRVCIGIGPRPVSCQVRGSVPVSL